MTTSSLFAGTSDDRDGAEIKQFGHRYRGRYHMPLLPGEAGTKAGGDWVPYGLRSATNLAGAIVDSRELSVWLIQRVMMGLALREDLYEKTAHATKLAKLAGVDLEQLRESDGGRQLIAELEDLAEHAKTAVGANAAGAMGTNRHDVWEMRARTGVLLGSGRVNAEIEALEALLDRHGLERVPGLQERVVRNVELEAAGRFDDVLLSRRTGRLYLADLKTKRKPFYSWLESWIQQAVYATAEWMLTNFSPVEIGAQDRLRGMYVPGPKHHVDQESGILLRMPSDGAPPFLQRVDIQIGVRWARLAKAVCDARSEARSVSTFQLAAWSEES